MRTPGARRLVMMSMLSVSSIAFAAPEDLVRAEPPGDDWSTRVQRIVVAMYDNDGSGEIDGAAELEQVSCPVFQAIDQGVRRDWGGSSVRVIYGFDEPYGWVGSALGFSLSLRDAAADAMTRCGITSAKAGTPTATTQVSAAAAIRAIGSGDQEGWDERVKGALIAAYDRDGSGEIDSSTELSAVSCDTWTALDRSVRQGWSGSSVRVIYGFDDGYIWVGYALGIQESLRAASASALESCGVSSDNQVVEPDGPTGAASGLDALMGASDWAQQVARVLVSSYDRDADGMIDTPSELKLITCEDWFALDRHVLAEHDGSAGLRPIYGFTKGYIWVGGSLAIHEKLRKKADAAMAKCGLE